MSTDSSSEGPQSITDVLLGIGQPTTKKVFAFIIAFLSMMLILSHVYTAAFTQVQFFVQRHFMLTMVMSTGFLMKPLGRKSWGAKPNLWFLVDLALIAMSIAPLVIVLSDLTRWEMGAVTSLTQTEMVAATLFLVAMLELTRRLVGWVLVSVTVFFILQNMYAPYMPQPFFGPSVLWEDQIHTIWGGNQGIFGMVAAIVTGFIIMFFFFAALLKSSGSGAVLLNLAQAVAGKYSGGPAKVSVVSSSLFGTMSGSPVANVVADGWFTIPMMKKLGFKPAFAGAVEAATSTGGQFMPPVMGLTAFIIPEFLGISYFRVCSAVLIPVFLYYLAVFMQVHLEAKKLGLEGIPVSQLPKLSTAAKNSWVIFIPLLAVFIMLIFGYSLARVALYATGLVLICGMISRTEPRLTPRSIFNAINEAMEMTLPAAATCGAMGIIIACFYASGVGDRLAFVIVGLSGGSLWVPLILTGVLCIILGMGVITPIIYIMMVLMTIPALITLGVEPLAAHMFAFFMGVASGITPPVCPTAYVAGAMAGAPMMKTGLLAFRLSIVGFLVPFLFVASPELLLIGTPTLIIAKAIFSTAAVFALAIGFEGWLVAKLSRTARLLFFISALACFWPYSIAVNIIGTVALAVLCVAFIRLRKKAVSTSSNK